MLLPRLKNLINPKDQEITDLRNQLKRQSGTEEDTEEGAQQTQVDITLKTEIFQASPGPAFIHYIK